MARGRPRKLTVDYFPHYTGASDGKTIFILQSKFGNDGYAFWFKLLEILGSSEGHFFDYRKTPDWEFLLAKTGISDNNKATEILNTLADLDTIDTKLHEQKVIWSQNFVDNLADLYKRRQIELPRKPVISADNKLLNADSKSISTSSNHQSKVKDSKGKDTIVKDTPLQSPQVPQLLDTEKVITAYEENILLNGTIQEEMRDEITIACGRYSPEWVHDAIKEACIQGQPTWRYIVGILQKWTRYGKTTSSLVKNQGEGKE